MGDYARAQKIKGKIKEWIRLKFFLFPLAMEVFLFLKYIVNFSIFGTLLSCFLRGDRELRVPLAGLSLSNDAFVRTSALCSKAELQPADPAIYNLTMSSCN